MTVSKRDNTCGTLARPYRARANRSLYCGGGTMTAGQTLTLESSPHGSEFLSLTVPAGKVWSFQVRLEIQQSDA